MPTGGPPGEIQPGNGGGKEDGNELHIFLGTLIPAWDHFLTIFVHIDNEKEEEHHHPANLGFISSKLLP